MTPKKTNMIKETDYLEKVQEYTKYLLERRPIPLALKLKNIESRKVGLDVQMAYLDDAEKKLNAKLQLIKDQKTRIRDHLTQIDKSIAETKVKVQEEEKKKTEELNSTLKKAEAKPIIEAKDATTKEEKKAKSVVIKPSRKKKIVKKFPTKKTTKKK